MRSKSEINSDIKKLIESNKEVFQSYVNLVSEYLDHDESCLLLTAQKDDHLNALIITDYTKYPITDKVH